MNHLSVEPLHDLISRTLPTDFGSTRHPGLRRVDGPLPRAGREPASALYEKELFESLLAHKEELGVAASGSASIHASTGCWISTMVTGSPSR
jgi:hypothetical protein